MIRVARAVPAAVLEALHPITPGKLAGLEMHVAEVEAEEALTMVANVSTPFGGEHAERYLEHLHQRRRLRSEFPDRLRGTLEDRKKEERRKAREENLVKMRALEAKLGAVEHLCRPG